MDWGCKSLRKYQGSLSQLAEETDSKSVQSQFESEVTYHIYLYFNMSVTHVVFFYEKTKGVIGMNTFLSSNDTQYRLLRTIFQGIIGVVIAYIDVIVGMFAVPDEVRPIIVAGVIVVLSPIMSCLKSQGKVITLTGGENDAVTDIEHELYEPDDEDGVGDDDE